VRKLDRQFGEVAIEVSDTGPGIPPETLADLRNSTSESRTVAGLGLRLARKQMASIGGHLEVVSSDPRGATLAMVIPVTIPVKDPASEPTLFDHSDSVLLRLLVVEDSDDSFAVFESFVKDEGHAITRAINGEEAVNMVKTGNFDMVIMDVQMPVMDGYTSTRAIRDWETKEGRVRRPILLLSADDPGRQKRIGSAAGCSGYLTKPTSKRELICALRSYSTVPAFPQSKDVDIHI
jgi:CheY-like chemotaxis protein